MQSNKKQYINVVGAKTHNLKNISIKIPREEFVIITGLSGSGKSSLAFDTIYAEGQRRYVESLSTYARQFLSVMQKPDVELIEGLSPAISIEQKTVSHNPRSTVGTVTEIYDYLRLFYARVGIARCPVHNLDLQSQTISEMVDKTLNFDEGLKLYILSPVVSDKKGEFQNLFKELYAQGYIRAIVDGVLQNLNEPIKLDKNKKHSIDVIIDRFVLKADMQLRLSQSFETAIHLSGGLAKVIDMDSVEKSAKEKKINLTFSALFSCIECNFNIPELEPRLFSFNNPSGACPDCEGLGHNESFSAEKIIASEDISIEDGALIGWDKKSRYYYEILEAVAKHYKFSLTISWKKLKDEHKQIILYGSKEKLDLPHGRYAGQRRFEGALERLKRRYFETESAEVRSHLEQFRIKQTCGSCKGSRLNLAASSVFIEDKNLPQIVYLSVEKLYDWVSSLELKGMRAEIGAKILKEICSRLSFLIDIGLNYLTLARSATTLSGGENQRIRLASQIGAGLVGVCYVLDEPSVGLHQKDNTKLINTLKKLRNLGNTVIVVEHDEETMLNSDFIIDIGPRAGVHGGEVIACGPPNEFIKNTKSITADYLSKRKSIEHDQNRSTAVDWIKIKGANGNNLKNISVEIPTGVITCVTGVSGSGKSSLINATLFPILSNKINKSNLELYPYKSIEGIESFDKIIKIDQHPIGKTPRSNPATYTGIFTPLRELFAATTEARNRGYKAGRFSFNNKGGRCESCQGEGLVKVEMHFLADVFVTCDICKGQRYNRETLDIKYKGKNIFDILQMTVEQASVFFDAIPLIKRKIDTLMEVGLNYITLGQNSTTLSGGEAQRIKLSKELSKRDTGQTIYLLDEPTNGLHFEDIKNLLKVLKTLKEHGNTLIIIEHNLDVIKNADWIIDIGPEGGDKGGEVIAVGTPEDVAKVAKSFTGEYLQKVLCLN